jgi:opacity protein-like surface antigen
MLRKGAIIAALALVLSPAAARADWLFTPNIGTTFGGAADGREHITYGASIGWMGAGIIGIEGDFQFTPEFFEGNDDDVDFFGSSNVFTAMGNVILGIPIGGQRGGGVRPFGIAGIGLIQQNTDADEALDIDSNEFGFNVGGGVMGFFNDVIGLRGDVRYVRSFADTNDNLVTIGVGDFDFWRANIGVVFRW